MSFKAPIPQHVTALELAQVIRTNRARFKRELHRCKTRDKAFSLLADNIDPRDPVPDHLRGATVFELVAACHRSANATARGVCLALDLPELKTVGSLTPRQRIALCRYLRTSNIRVHYR